MRNIFKQYHKYRILSIDGGGSKGVFTAYAIMKLEEDYGVHILDHFDMVIGTSTGALIAASLVKGIPAKVIYQNYIEKNLFGPKRKLSEQLKGRLFAQYDSIYFEEQLRAYFSDMSLTDLYEGRKNKVEFAFCASNFTKGEPIIFTSPKFKNLSFSENDATVFEALRSSCAAPTFFEPMLFKKTGDYLLDGGLWANNPSMAGMNLAVSISGFKYKEIDILSFGQSYNQVEYEINKPSQLIKSPLKNQLWTLAKSAFAMNQDVQTLTAESILEERYFRYVPEEPQKDAKINEFSVQFLNYTKMYWRNNKDALLEFISSGINEKYNNNKKGYN